jgi:hypothetical protein
MSLEAAPYQLLGVAHVLQPWSEPIQDLEQLRANVATAPANVLFVHLLQCQLRHAAAAEQPMDDISHWVASAVQDPETAEKLWFALASAELGAEPARKALLDVLDKLPQTRRNERRGPLGGAFTMLTSLSVPFPYGEPYTDPREMIEALIRSDVSVWFLHLLEEPWSRGARPTLTTWLDARGEHRMARWLDECASAGLPLGKVCAKFQRRWRLSQVGRRLAAGELAGQEPPPHVTREAAALLAKRLAGEESAS